MWHWPARWLANEHHFNWLSYMRRPLLLRKPGNLSTDRRQELCNHVQREHNSICSMLIWLLSFVFLDMSWFQFSCWFSSYFMSILHIYQLLFLSPLLIHSWLFLHYFWYRISYIWYQIRCVWWTSYDQGQNRALFDPFMASRGCSII